MDKANIDKIRLSIVGLGLVGRRHAKAIESLANVELVGIVDPDVHATEPCYYLATARHCNSIDELLDVVKPDGVIIASPTLLHLTQASQCINENFPVLVEKPLGASVVEAQQLVELAESKNVPLLTGHHRRYNPLIQKAHALLAEGIIGDIRAVQASCWFYKPNHYFEQAPWRTRKGAGPISVNLSHDIDLLRYLVGDITSVQAHSSPSQRGYENEDVAAALLTFASGAMGTITVSDSIASPWSWEHTSGEYPVYPITTENCYLFGGSLGSLSLPDLRVWQHHSKQPDWWSDISGKSHSYEASDPLVNQISHFANVIRGKEEPLVSGQEGLATLRVIDAISEAAATGKKITLPGQ